MVVSHSKRSATSQQIVYTAVFWNGYRLTEDGVMTHRSLIDHKKFTSINFKLMKMFDIDTNHLLSTLRCYKTALKVVQIYTRPRNQLLKTLHSMNIFRFFLGFLVLSTQLFSTSDSQINSTKNIDLVPSLNTKKRHKEKTTESSIEELASGFLAISEIQHRIQNIINYDPAGSDKARKMELYVPRNFNNVHNIVSNLKEAAKLYEKAAKTTLDLIDEYQ